IGGEIVNRIRSAMAARKKSMAGDPMTATVSKLLNGMGNGDLSSAVLCMWTYEVLCIFADCFVMYVGMGAAYGTAKSGVGVASMGVMRPELVMKSIVPVVMAGVLGIYGLIIAVIISTGINPKAKSYYLFDGYAHLSSGLACGLAGLSAGMAIGIVGDAGVRANAQQPKLFVGMILILIFAEALALYGLIVGIILSSRAGQSRAD
ncbi:hypothetical protein M8C21_015611, partial [Ambrosia artemisiifolia]